ncbi:YceD family protein [Streptococcus tangpeifui]|uniref:YceD family protein n=1 Tax=Streptococcus tangpeifui TaxID=2709400 RepID=UPI0013EADEBF|nr:YceD family protein [Streptococcus sp. ZJ1593]
MFNIAELKKNPEGLHFDQELDIKSLLLSRNSEIIDVKDVKAKGLVGFDDGLFLLNYDLTYQLTLPSSRSMEPVAFDNSYFVSEVFIEASQAEAKKDLVDEDMVLILETDTIDLEESVVDNILLNIPLRVLTQEEAADDSLPAGNDWSVLTESQYRALQEKNKEANNPFAALDGLFDPD